MLRFKNDDGSEFPEWEEKKIGELGTFIKGAALSKADISESGSPLILYGELYTTYKEVAYNIQRKTQAIVDKKYYSCVGDVIIPTSGESAEEISTATCVMVPDVILGGDLNIFRSNIVDGRIMSYILNHQVKEKIATIAQGKSIVHIQAKQLANICVKYPLSKVEQRKIAEFLSTIDTVIGKQRATVSAWEKRKKGVMQKLFSQEVRFKADDGSDFPDWEEKNFLDCISKIVDFRGRTPLKLGTNWNEEKSEYLALSALNVKKGYIDDTVDAHYGNEELYNIWMKGNELYKGQVLFTTEAPMGNVAQVPDDKPYILSQRTIAFVPDYTLLQDDFLAVLLSSADVQKKLDVLATGGTAKGVSQKSLKSLDVKVPCLAEQQKIADCLSSLDEVIEKQKATLAAWEELKKGLLQQMFV